MNGHELLGLTRNNRHIADVMRGVFSSNNLPQKVSKYPSAYICNTDPTFLPGSHWVVFWIHSPVRAEFYDSFGNLPGYYGVAFDVFLQNVNIVYTITFKFNTGIVIHADIMYCFIYG